MGRNTKEVPELLIKYEDIEVHDMLYLILHFDAQQECKVPVNVLIDNPQNSW